MNIHTSRASNGMYISLYLIFEAFLSHLGFWNPTDLPTLPESNSSHPKMGGWKTILSFWDGCRAGANCLVFRVVYLWYAYAKMSNEKWYFWSAPNGVAICSRVWSTNFEGQKNNVSNKKGGSGKKLVGQNSPAVKQSLLQRSFSSRGYVTF